MNEGGPINARLIKCPDAVWVLHCFQKKTQKPRDVRHGLGGKAPPELER